MNIDQEQEIVRIGKTLEKITHNDLSVAISVCTSVFVWVGFNKNTHPLL